MKTHHYKKRQKERKISGNKILSVLPVDKQNSKRKQKNKSYKAIVRYENGVNEIIALPKNIKITIF